ncbi:MAG: DUF4375 domain-containing protein [Pseudomonadota bacterium]
MGLFNAPRAYPEFYAPYNEEFNFYEGREVWLASIENIPEKAVNLFAVHWLHLEVHNGGFWQYFFNSTGTSAPEAERGFRAIGMSNVGDIVAQAIAKVGDPFPGNKHTRRKIVGDPDNRMDFDDLEMQFYELADTEQFFRKLPKFVPYADRYAATG